MDFKGFLRTQHPNGTYASVEPHVLDSDYIMDWCRENGIGKHVETLAKPSDLHMTIIYSSRPCPAMVKHDGTMFKPLELVGSPARWRILGPAKEKVLALELASKSAEALHHKLKSTYGAVHDYDSFLPHVTIGYGAKGTIPELIPPHVLEFVRLKVTALEP